MLVKASRFMQMERVVAGWSQIITDTTALMLLELFHIPVGKDIRTFNVFGYITLRAPCWPR